MQNPYERYIQSQSQTPAATQKNKAPSRRRAMTRGKTRTPVKKSKKSSGLLYLSLSFFGLCLSFYAFAYTDEFLALVNRVEVGTNMSWAADDKGKKEEAKDVKAEALPVGRVTELKSDSDHLTMKNADIYKALADKRRALEKKERRLNQLEEDLQRQKEEIEKQLKEMQSMRQNISTKLDRKVAADKASVDKLVGVYSSMKPQNAAVILSDIDEELAVKILGKMKKQSAAEILNYVAPQKAQVLSEKFTGIKK